ncbi:MAG: hypothetical protein ACYSW4_02225 [Planctomycetota bacterium]|jgi:ABC-type hemin transport system ATPase subunit
MNLAAAIAGRAILLDRGRIIVDGDAKKVMSDSQLMVWHGLEVPAELKDKSKMSPQDE